MKKITKFTACLLFVLLCAVTFSGCTADLSKRDINYLIGHAPRFDGIVRSAEEDCILVDLEQTDPLCGEHPTIRVSLNVINSDSGRYFYPGDEVCVLYDGNLTDEDPAAAETVYAILLSKASEARKEAEMSET